jgi:hypothetical protein
MLVAIPERTVDTWVTAYLAGLVPDMLLWAPTQRQTPDHDLAGALPGPGKLFVLENKAPYATRHFGFRLELRQLWNYLRNPDLRARTFYVLPCPPFPLAEVPGTPGAYSPPAPDLMPRRTQSRRRGHPWQGGLPCEEWFRVVPALDLWAELRSRTPPPQLGAPAWPTPRRGRPPQLPAGAPPERTLGLRCPLPATLGESLRSFMDRLLACELSAELRVEPERGGDDVLDRVARSAGSPLYQAQVAFVAAHDIPGWKG